MQSLSRAFSGVASWFVSWVAGAARYREATRKILFFRSQSVEARRQILSLKTEIEDLQSQLDASAVDVHHLTVERNLLSSEVEVQKSEIGLLTSVIERDLARLEAETAIQATRKVRALSARRPPGPEE